MFILTTLFNTVWQNPASEIHQEKERRGLYIERIEIKYFLLADDTIVYVESLKESMEKKILELISDFSKITRYKINVNNQMYLYILAMNRRTQKHCNYNHNTITFTIAQKWKTGINLTKMYRNNMFKTIKY